MNHFYGFKYNHEREQKRERDEYHADSEQELKADGARKNRVLIRTQIQDEVIQAIINATK